MNNIRIGDLIIEPNKMVDGVGFLLVDSCSHL